MKLTDEQIEKIANEYFLKAWNENSDECSPRGAFKAGFQACRDIELKELLSHYEGVLSQYNKTNFNMLKEIDSLKSQVKELEELPAWLREIPKPSRWKEIWISFRQKIVRLEKEIADINKEIINLKVFGNIRSANETK